MVGVSASDSTIALLSQLDDPFLKTVLVLPMFLERICVHFDRVFEPPFDVVLEGHTFVRCSHGRRSYRVQRTLTQLVVRVRIHVQGGRLVCMPDFLKSLVVVLQVLL